MKYNQNVFMETKILYDNLDKSSPEIAGHLYTALHNTHTDAKKVYTYYITTVHYIQT